MTKKFTRQLLLAGLLVILSGISVSQVYLPSADLTIDPPVEFDPDILRTFTDESGGANARDSSSCGGCRGIIYSRLGDVEITQESPPRFVFDYQIRAGQSATDDFPNYLQSVGAIIIYGSRAFGENQFEPANNGDCTVEDRDQFTAGTSIRGGFVDTGASLASGVFLNAGLGPPTLLTSPPVKGETYVIEESDFRTVTTISCEIKDSSAPANVAIQARTITENQQSLEDGSYLEYAPVAENNLWYYPLDESPAIIDVEASGGGDHFYIDVTFNKGISKADGTAVGMAEFAGAVTLIPRTTAYGADRSADRSTHTLTLASVTKPGGAFVKAGDTVIRLRFNEDPADEAAKVMTDDPNILLSVEPPDNMIYAEDDTQDPKTAELHRGEEWWVRAWYDHRAPYIMTAEVGGGNSYVDVAFSQPVKFDFSFDANTPPQAVMTGTTAPEPEDFVIRYYDRSADMFTDHQPDAIQMQDPSGAPINTMPATGVTRLRVMMPSSIPSYGPGDTLDIRTAQRQENPDHPSLASVFIYGAGNLGAPDDMDNAEFRKNGKFADTVGNTNFPRTAAFAQVGSLPLKRTLDVTFELGAQDLVIDGTAVEIKVGLFGASAALLAQDEAVTVDVAWQGAAPADVALSGETGITLTGGQPVGTFTAQAGANASDGDSGVLAITAAYDGDAVAASVTIVDDDTLDVRVVQEVPVELMFEVSEAIVRIGATTEVMVTLSNAAALGSNQVEVMFTIETATGEAVEGVTADPITFDGSGSPQTVTIEAGSNAMTRLSGVVLKSSVTTAQQSDLQDIDPVPVRFIESTLPVEVLPDFAFADVRNDKPDEFAALITDSAPGARLLLDSGYDAIVSIPLGIFSDDILIVPGTGGRMKLDLYAPVMTKTGDVRVCVWVYEDQLLPDFNDCSKAEDYKPFGREQHG